MPANRLITVRDLLTFRMGMGFITGSPETHPILKAMIEQKVDVGPHLSTAPGPDAWIRGLGSLLCLRAPARIQRAEVGVYGRGMGAHGGGARVEGL